MLKAIAALVMAAAGAAAPVQMVDWLSSSQNDYNLSFDAGRTVLVFARSEADFRNARIFFAEKKGRSWTKPKPISFSGPNADSDPWLTPDGKTLYFISDRPAPAREAGRKYYDIWRSYRLNGRWSAPERLGEEVNSKGQELGVEFHRGTLYFASGRRSGKGGLDIYSATLGTAGFEAAKPIEGPFNSAESDSDFTLSPDGRTALFWRTVEGKGMLHVSRRSRSGWSDPKPLPQQINRGDFNFTPSISADGRSFWFASTAVREGQDKGLADIYKAPLPKP